MDDQALFTLAHAVVLPAWALLLLLPRWRIGTDLIAPVIAPGAIALLYLGLLATGEPVEGGGFSSLDEVAVLFSDRRTVLIGWLHYLCFDLFIGAWEARDARRLGLPRLLVAPTMVLTLMLGPIGLLCYLCLRTGLRGRLATAEEATEAGLVVGGPA
jgi:hypothetical protein